MEGINISKIVHSLKNFIDNAQWEDAINLLETNKDQFDSALYHYNLGVVKVNMSDYSIAMYHFEKAKQLGFSSIELTNSINSLQEKLNVSYIYDSLGAGDYCNLLLFDLPQSFYYSIFLIGLILLIVNIKKITTTLRITYFLVSLLPVFIFNFYILPKNIVISQSSIKVYTGPSRIFDQVQEIPEGVKLIIGKQYNGWKKVIYPHRFEGWISSDRYLDLRN